MQELLDRFQVWSDRFCDSPVVDKIFMIGLVASGCFSVGFGIGRAAVKINAWRTDRNKRLAVEKDKAHRAFIRATAKEVEDLLETPKIAVGLPSKATGTYIGVKLPLSEKHVEINAKQWEDVFDYIRGHEGCSYDEAVRAVIFPT